MPGVWQTAALAGPAGENHQHCLGDCVPGEPEYEHLLGVKGGGGSNDQSI